MKDSRGRDIVYLRLSVTERCTLKCEYCRADEGECPKQKELSADELELIVRAAAELGVTKIRLTGGEPLLRRDIVELVSRFKAVQGITEIAMTTNAQQLCGRAKGLKAAGLDRLNISLDSLRPERYKSITGGGEIEPVLAGIDEALAAGLTPLKINAVVVRGRNDDEIDDFIELTCSKAVDVRFIELMPMGEMQRNIGLRVPSEELISARPYLQPLPPRYESQPSQDYMVEGHLGRVGFISPVSHKFCGACNRIRVMSDGMLRPCLGSASEVSLKPALGRGYEALVAEMRRAIYDKPEGHCFEKGVTNGKNMNRIGG